MRDVLGSSLPAVVAVILVVAGCSTTTGPTASPTVPASATAYESPTATGPSAAPSASVPATTLTGRFAYDDHGIWVMDGDGSNKMRLSAPGSGVDFDASWRPDGGAIVFRTGTTVAFDNDGLETALSCASQARCICTVANYQRDFSAGDTAFVYGVSERDHI